MVLDIYIESDCFRLGKGEKEGLMRMRLRVFCRRAEPSGRSILFLKLVQKYIKE
jgi:hypothetical protein